MSLMEAWRRKFEKGTKRIIYRIRNCRRTFNLQSARSIYDELLYLHIFAVKVLQFKEVVRQPATMKAVDDGWRLEVATRKTRAPLLDAAVRLERKYVRHPKRRSAYQNGAVHIEADVRGVPIGHRRLTARDPSATVCSPRSVSLADVESSRRTRAGATGCSRKRPRRECVSASLCVGNPVVASDRTTPGCACPADTCLTWRASIGPGTQTCCSQWATRRVAARPLVASCCIAEWAYVAHEINGQNLER